MQAMREGRTWPEQWIAHCDCLGKSIQSSLDSIRLETANRANANRDFAFAQIVGCQCLCQALTKISQANRSCGSIVPAKSPFTHRLHDDGVVNRELPSNSGTIRVDLTPPQPRIPDSFSAPGGRSANRSTARYGFPCFDNTFIAPWKQIRQVISRGTCSMPFFIQGMADTNSLLGGFHSRSPQRSNS